MYLNGFFENIDVRIIDIFKWLFIAGIIGVILFKVFPTIKKIHDFVNNTTEKIEMIAKNQLSLLSLEEKVDGHLQVLLLLLGDQIEFWSHDYIQQGYIPDKQLVNYNNLVHSYRKHGGNAGKDKLADVVNRLPLESAWKRQKVRINQHEE